MPTLSRLHLRILSIGLFLLLLFALVVGLNTHTGADTTRTRGASGPGSSRAGSAGAWGSAESEAGFENAHRLTRVRAHAPGFTIFENLYYQNNTYLILTSETWSVPPLQHIAQPGFRDEKVGSTRVPVRLLAVRGPRGGPQDDGVLGLVGESVSPEEAAEMADGAEDLDAPMMLNNDDMFVGHYYHWIGETFLGMWRLWKHWEWSRGVPLPEFATIAFARTDWYTGSGLPEDFAWEDRQGVNRFFMEALFPNAKIEARPDWEKRDATNKLYRLPLVVMADRKAGHSGPIGDGLGKPFGDVLRLPVARDYLLQLRDRVLKDYAGPITIDTQPARPRVVYLSRQDTTRRLTDEANAELILALKGLKDEGLVNFHIINFSREVGYRDQIAHMTNIDFLVAVHGNGLTHSLWMTPGEGRAVFELVPHDCSMNDYSPLAHAAGVTHFLVSENKMCGILDCAPRGCWDPNRDDIKVEPKLITDKIREMVEKHYRA